MRVRKREEAWVNGGSNYDSLNLGEKWTEPGSSLSAIGQMDSGMNLRPSRIRRARSNCSGTPRKASGTAARGNARRAPRSKGQGDGDNLDDRGNQQPIPHGRTNPGGRFRDRTVERWSPRDRSRYDPSAAKAERLGRRCSRTRPSPRGESKVAKCLAI